MEYFPRLPRSIAVYFFESDDLAFFNNLFDVVAWQNFNVRDFVSVIDFLSVRIAA